MGDAEPARGRPRRRRARVRDDPPDADLPPERRDAARLARRGADRRADRPRQPPRADAARSTRSLADARAESPARARALRPRRLQALQRHLRPPRRRRPARPPRRQPAGLPRTAAATPSGWAATSSARCSSCAARTASTLVEGAALALSEHGEGFWIGCSYGSIIAADRGRRTPTRRCGSPTSACTPRRTPAARRPRRQVKDVAARPRWPSATRELARHVPRRRRRSPRPPRAQLGLEPRGARDRPPRRRAARVAGRDPTHPAKPGR